MTEKKWAPGPWEIEADEDSCMGAVYIGRVDHRGIMPDPVCSVPSEYDAYLIAAAPEMYEELERLVQEDYERGEPGHYERTGPARRVMAKARGESQ